MESREALENWYNTQSPSTKAYEYELHYRIIKKDLDKLKRIESIIKDYEKYKSRPYRPADDYIRLIKEVLENERIYKDK